MPAKTKRLKREKAYHHGDLRNAATKAAEAMLEAGDVSEITLREVGRRLGVSHAALYRHFPDRQALLVEVATHGFTRLESALKRAAHEANEDAGGVEGKLKRMLDAYINFAKRHTGCFRLMYGPELADRAQFPELAAAVGKVFDVLLTLMTAAQDDGRMRQGPTLLVGAGAFAMAHGLAVLMVNGLLKHGQLKDAPREKIIESAWEALWNGIGR